MKNIINQSSNNVNRNNLNVVFLGTPQFAVPILEKLMLSEYKPVAVFCAPDKPVGRKQTLTSPPTKLVAQKNNIAVFQPETVSDLVSQISSIKPDLIISAAFGLILPAEILNVPKYCCLNIHPSLLPKYRGPSPIQAAIINGDQETGVTIYKMDEKIDHGQILGYRKMPLTNNKYTTPEVSDILSKLGVQLLLDILPNWLIGKIRPEPQDESRATYTKIIKKESGKINWKKSAREIEQQIRAFTPWPGSFSEIQNCDLDSKNLKIIKADFSEEDGGQAIGKVFLTSKNELAVQTSIGCLVIETLQLEGHRPKKAQDFLRGNRQIVGCLLN